MIRSHRDLVAWQHAMELAEAVYALAGRLPRHEAYALGGQLRRTAVSVPANIAEGHGREHLGDYLRHLSIARGSLAELDTLVILAERLYQLPPECLASAVTLAGSTGRLVSALMRSLRRRRPRE